MADDKRERGVKCLVKRKICVIRDGKEVYKKPGVHVLSKDEYEAYVKDGVVTQDVILDD